MDKSPRLAGQEWQDWATQLLHCHYAKGDYQPVPDKDRGDAGIEGFSTNGCVYQMYGPEGELTFAQRHNRIRDKITRDITKFIADKDGKLSKLFGGTKIRRWILLVPYFDSRELVEHAARKTKEVLAAGLAYVDCDEFTVVILEEDAFAVEKAMLLKLNVSGIDISTAPICEQDIEGWAADEANAFKVEHLATKTARMPTLADETNRAEFEREVITWWLEGQNVLDELRAYPEAWEVIRRAKSEQEKYLRGHCMVTDQRPYPLLQEALAKIAATVETEAAALSFSTRQVVAHEAVADWLMRCPLNFPEVASNESDRDT